MAKSKFTGYSAIDKLNGKKVKEPEPTLDKSKIIEDFGWYEQEISLARLLQLAQENKLDISEVVVGLSFMNDPYNENPHLLLMKK